MARDWQIERLRPSGMIMISERDAHGDLIKRRYQGYTLAEAKAAFRAEFPKRKPRAPKAS